MEWVHQTELTGHTDSIESISLSKDGKRLASCSSDGSVLIWDLTDPSEKSGFTELELDLPTKLERLVFNPINDELLVVAGDKWGMSDGQIEIIQGSLCFDALGAQEVIPFSSNFLVMAISPDGKWLAFGYHKHRIEIWDYQARERAFELVGPPVPDSDQSGSLRCLSFSRDGKLLASGATDCSLNVWDLEQRKIEVSFLTRKTGAASAHFSPSRNRLYTSAEASQLQCWDLSSGEEIYAAQGGTTIALSPDGKIIGVGSPNPTRLHKAQDGSQIQMLDQMGTWHLAFTPDGQRLIGAGGGEKIHIWKKVSERDDFLTTIYHSDSWFESLVQYYAELGFFAELAGAEPDQMVEEVRKRFTQDMISGVPQTPATNLDLLYVLAQDHQRVWWFDLESDVCSANQRYIPTLKNFAAISAGYFDPQQITEKWESETGPILVAFKLNNQQIGLKPKYAGDYIDIHILREINALMEKYPLKFEMFTPFDQTAYIITLTEDQKQRLSEDLGFTFSDLGGH